MARSKFPRLIRVVSETPPYRVSQAESKAFAEKFFHNQLPGLDRLLELFERSGIDSRNFCTPLEWFYETTSFEEKNNRYITEAVKLSVKAVRKVISSAGVELERIDYLIFVSTTGVATPSIDARLIGELGLRPDTKRIPVWGLGCGGGALGLGHVADLLKGNPDSLALLVNVELCGLTFNNQDYSKSNLVATALFADGVTAALIAGANCALPGAEIFAHATTLWPDSLDVMGWNFLNSGMQVVFSKAIPAIVEDKMADCVQSFLEKEELALDDINHFLIHPGGVKVIEAFQQALGLSSDKLDIARHIMRENGNCSSCSVMQVIEEFQIREIPQKGDIGLVTALGPGFSAGNALLRF